MHLDGKSTGSGLALPLTAGALAKAGEELLADGHIACGVARAGVIDQHLEVHFGLAAQTFHIGEKVPLVGPNGAAEAVIVGKGSSKTEGKYGGKLEAFGDDPGMVLSMAKTPSGG